MRLVAAGSATASGAPNDTADTTTETSIERSII
jgi:hypothetical protein